MLNELAKQIHENAKSKGFYEGEKNIGEMLCLIHSEVSEAMEADRKGKYSKEDARFVCGHLNDEDFLNHFAWIKSSFEDECSDIIIRVLDLCAFKGINIDAHIKAKMRYNSTRPYKHGKKY